MDEEGIIAEEGSQVEDLAWVEMEAREADPTQEVVLIKMIIKNIEMKFMPHYSGKQLSHTYDTVKDHIVLQVQNFF